MRRSPKPKPPGFVFVSAAVLVLGTLFVLATSQPAAAQAFAAFAAQTTPRARPATPLVPLGATFSVTSTLPPLYHSENPADQFDFRAVAAYPARDFAALFPFQQTKTSFVTELRVPLAQFYGSRLRFGFLLLTLQSGNLTFGPLATLQALHSSNQPRSLNFYGFGLSIPLGKQADTEISRNLFTAARRFLHDR